MTLYLLALIVCNPSSDIQLMMMANSRNVELGYYLGNPEFIDTYWNTYVYNDMAGNYKEAGEALLGFIVHVSQFLEMVRGRNIKISGQQLKTIEDHRWRAINILDIYWARKVESACKCEILACFIKDISSIPLFGRGIPFCGDRSKILNIEIKRKKEIAHVVVQCSDKDNEEYYFVVVGDTEKNGEIQKEHNKSIQKD